MLKDVTKNTGCIKIMWVKLLTNMKYVRLIVIFYNQIMNVDKYLYLTPSFNEFYKVLTHALNFHAALLHLMTMWFNY